MVVTLLPCTSIAAPLTLLPSLSILDILNQQRRSAFVKLHFMFVACANHKPGVQVERAQWQGAGQLLGDLADAFARQ